MSKSPYIMIGRFLGAGKTTAVAQFAQRLSAAGQRVGLFTNDQGSELVDTAMLRKLAESGVAFDAVADLCEMSARQDPSLKRLADGGVMKIAASFPRAVKGLFHSAKADLPLDTTAVLNMRVQRAEEVCAALFTTELKPNLPKGKVTASDTPKAAATAQPP